MQMLQALAGHMHCKCKCMHSCCDANKKYMQLILTPCSVIHYVTKAKCDALTAYCKVR